MGDIKIILFCMSVELLAIVVLLFVLIYWTAKRR